MNIIETLQKIEGFEDQAIVGLVRTSNTLDTVIKVLQSIRAADLGPDSNAIVDELIKVGQKAQVIVGVR